MRHRPFRHLGLKVLSLALAVLLWLVVAGEQVVERGLRVPLEFRTFRRRSRSSATRRTTVDVRRARARRRCSAGCSRATSSRCSIWQRARRARGCSTSARRGARAVRRRGRAGGAVDARAGARDARRGATVPVVPAVEGDPAPGFVVGRMSSEPGDGGDRRARERGAADHGSDDRAGVGDGRASRACATS